MINTLLIMTSFLIGEDSMELRPGVAQPIIHLFYCMGGNGRKGRGKELTRLDLSCFSSSSEPPCFICLFNFKLNQRIC